MKHLRNDYRWGAIQLLKRYAAPLYKTGPKGERYVADTHGGPVLLRLRCDCGHEWEIEERDFPGRRKLRSCGRPQCTVKPGPRPPKARRPSISMSLSAETIAGIEEYAKAKGMNISQAANALIDKSLTDYLVNGD